MQLIASLTSLIALAATATAPPPATASLQKAFGTWSNPNRTLAVHTSSCVGGLCGAIVWANSKVLHDAREAGVTHLIGTELLQNYRPMVHGGWQGRIYVPDVGHSFPSHIVQTGPNQLTISGCLIGGLLCRSQVWRRVG